MLMPPRPLFALCVLLGINVHAGVTFAEKLEQDDCNARGVFNEEKCYSVFSHCEDFVVYDDAYKVQNVTALLLMDSRSDDLSDHVSFQASGASRGSGSTILWDSGHSNLTIQLELGSGSKTFPKSVEVTAHIHEKRCDVDQGGGHYMRKSDGKDGGQNIFTVMLGQSSSGVAGSAKRDYLVDYDRARSIVFHEPEGTGGQERKDGGDGAIDPLYFAPSKKAGARFACCNLVPRLPLLPNAWTAVIEANFGGVNKSYTLTRREWYDSKNGASRIDDHSALSKRTQIMDVDPTPGAYPTRHELHMNVTFPDGHCTLHDLNLRFPRLEKDHEGGMHMRTTADFFRFKGDTPDVYEGSGSDGDSDGGDGGGFMVRGVPCERWVRNLSFPVRFSGMAPRQYQIEFYFPVLSWRVRRESYHRQLARIVVRSDAGFRGGPIVHHYDFVDFSPGVADYSVFDPCNVYPGGGRLAGNCTCGSRVAALGIRGSASGGGDNKRGPPPWHLAVATLVSIAAGAALGSGATYMRMRKSAGGGSGSLALSSMQDNPMSEATQL